MYQKLGHVVGNHLVSRHVSKVDFSSNYLISDIMILDVNVLCLRMEDGVVDESNRALIISFQKDCISDRVYLFLFCVALLLIKIDLGLDLDYSCSFFQTVLFLSKVLALLFSFTTFILVC